MTAGAATAEIARRVLAPADLLQWRHSGVVAGAPVAVVSGTFDILQPGNWQALEAAAECAPHVCVVLEPDRVAAAHLPAGRPHHDLAARAEFVAHLRRVSAVTSLQPTEAAAFFAALRPYCWVVGTDDRRNDPYAAAAAGSAARVVELEPVAGCRTEDIHRAIREGCTPIPLPANLRCAAETEAARAPAGTGVLATVNGCFDILHIGHARFLAQARALADRLIVLVNDDASLRRYKGPARPVFPLPFRVAALRALAAVDDVAAFPEDNPLRLLREIRPQVHIKGGTYEEDRVRDERAALETWGGRVEFCELVEGFSTTAYIRKALGISG